MKQNSRKCFFLIIILVLCCEYSFSQQARRQNMDSLLQQLPYIKEDTSGVTVLRRLGGFYLRVNLDSAFMYLHEGLVLAKKLNFTSELLHLNQNLATAYLFTGNLDKAISSYENGHKAALVHGDTLRSMLILTELIIAARDKGDTTITNNYFKVGYELASEMPVYGDYFNARLDMNKAGIFKDHLAYDSAFYYWDRALQGMISLDLPGFTAVVHNNMAVAYFEIYDYPKALKAHKKALELATSIDYRPVELDAEIGISRVYGAIDNADLAIERLTPLLEEEKKTGQLLRILKVEQELVRSYYQKKDYDKALELSYSAYKKGKQLGFKSANNAKNAHYTAQLWFKKGRLDSSFYYLNISDSLAETHNRSFAKFSNLVLRVKHENLSGNHKVTYPLLAKADSIANKLLGPKQRAEISYMNYLYHREMGNLSFALGALEKSNNLNDSLKNLEQRGDLIKLGSEIETAEKQAELEKRQDEIESLTTQVELRKTKTKQFIIFLSIALVLITLIVVWRIRALKLSRRLRELESEKLQDELSQKKRKLTSNALQEAHKNQLLESLLTETKNIQSAKNTDLSKLIRLVKEGLNSEKNLELFTLQFEETHPDFFSNLRKFHPNLTPREQQICALVNLNFSTKEIASFLGIEVGSATTARYRLRQKLEIEKEQNLAKYLQNLNSL